MRLLVIDDEPLILEAIESAFLDEIVVCCQTAEDGIQAFLDDRPDVVLCDIRMPGMSGMETFEKLHRIDAKIPIVLMTGHGTAGTAIDAMQRGAFEYVLKPLDPDTLIPLIENAAETSRMTRVPALVPNDMLISDTEDGLPHDSTSDMLIGMCSAMQEVYRSIGRVAKQDVTVLILGESGTGKEVIARAIYQYGSRPNARFLAINCAAIPEQLLESELFGHEKGAFTGADTKRIGKFELCSEGTLFLDEIGDMTPLMQTKILRVLQDQTFERVGGSQTIRTNARIIAATNRNLEQAIKDKQFRSDLFYRLNVYTINLPALRERGDDIRLLANYFIRRFSQELEKEISGIAPEAMRLLLDYAWPGNVRELQSLIKHALLEATSPIIVPAFLPSSLTASLPKLSLPNASQANMLPSAEDAAMPAVPSAVDNVLDFAQLTRDRLDVDSEDIYRELIALAEQKIFTEVLRHVGGNLTQAAKHLGITRTTLRARLDTLGISLAKSASIGMK